MTKTGLAKMFKGGVIMDVVNAEQVRASPSQRGPTNSVGLTSSN